ALLDRRVADPPCRGRRPGLHHGGGMAGSVRAPRPADSFRHRGEDPLMTSRLGTHLLRRLRHRLENEALDRAVDADILLAATQDVDGVQIRGFTAHPAMLQRTPGHIQQLVARFGSRDGSSRSTATTSFTVDDVTYVFEDDTGQ